MPGRILVVDDDARVADVLTALLQIAGYEVEVATTLAAARSALPRADLMILDLVLPDGSALDFCRQVRATPELARLPIIVLSGHGTPSDRTRGLEAGADDYVAKPFDGEELLQRVHTLLHTRRIEAELRERTRQLSALRHLTTILVNTVEVSEVAQRVANAVPEVFGADSGILGGVLCALDEAQRELTFFGMTDIPILREATAHLDQPARLFQARCDPPENLLGQVARDGLAREAVHLADFISPPASPTAAEQIERHLGMRGGVAMPVRAQGKRTGVFLFLSTRPPTALEPAERELMRDFVDTIGIALENVRLYAEAAHLMITDSLTGVANRRRFDQVLEEEISRARRLDYPVGLLLIDIDRFKEYNDRHGHQAGDRILQAVAQALRTSVRRTDLIARYGGEEFTAILPGTPVAGLRAVGEKLRQAVRAVRLNDLPEIAGVTVSIGGAAGTPPDLSADALVRAADMAQYLAKRAGGDRVHVVDTSPRP
ncbi:MAG TPA: diguanylate cyclase [Chloroflexota bacterium]|nr:diguanylate cyclase [Chloroflexota bacterium]